MGISGLGVARYLSLTRGTAQLQDAFVDLPQTRGADRLAVRQAAAVGVDGQTARNVCLTLTQQDLLLAVSAETVFSHVHDLGSGLGVLQLGNINVLIAELDKLYGKRTRVWVTEYGYQTNPPDRIFGVTLSKQAKYLTQAVAVARANPRIDLFLWFLLRDEQRLSGWQSGLTTFEGKRKPSFDAFRRAAASLLAP